MTRKQAIEIAGTLSEPSKMPAYSYGLPTAACITGSKLASIKGSACFGCYANKGFYQVYKTAIQKAQYKRLESIMNPFWVDAMVTLIAGSKKSPYFRWHDSGDLQSVEHLEKIAEIARKLPKVKFWLPTREYQIVTQFKALYACPGNLVIRLSAHMVGATLQSDGPISSIFTGSAPKGAQECPARHQGNACGDCRACWDPKVKYVSYHLH